jgi:hypothetical protein
MADHLRNTAIGPTLLMPRSKASPLDDALHGRLILPATELKSFGPSASVLFMT